MINSQMSAIHISQFNADNVKCANKGVLGYIPAGTTSTVDLKIIDDVFITGGVLYVKNATFGDSVSFIVTDKDNIFGLGAGFVLGQYIDTWYVCEASQRQFDEKQDYPKKIPAGLYLTIVYASTGTQDVQVAMNYRLHEALV